MHPLLTFSAGLMAGLAAVRLLKSEKTRAAAAGGRSKVRAGLDNAQEHLRDAAVASLAAVEQTSARLRTRLTPAEDEPAPEPAQPAQAAPQPTTEPTPPRAATRKKAASKPAGKTTKPGTAS